jgi:DNA (cytosine-5)-methyltransferase 1
LVDEVQETAMKSTNSPTMVDLFCGAGGLSLGFVRAGFTPIMALESERSAVDTYRRNLGDHVHEVRVEATSVLPTSTVIIGGPPCQGFSSAGMRKPGDPRNGLIAVFSTLVARLRPSAFLFENVEGFLTAGGGARVFDLLEPLLDAGYRIHLRKVNAANYGVPQHRKRVLAIGGLGWDPTFPEPTHRAHGAPGADLVGQALPSTPTISVALAGLPDASPEPPGEPEDHFYRPLRDIDLERIRQLKPGMTMRDLPQELWHESYRRRAYRRVMDGTPTERRGGAPAGVRRLRADEPCKAVTAGARSEFVHPTHDRFLTLRECARLQTFPDDFSFKGNQSQRALLIGNAVPPLLSEVFAKVLLDDLRRHHDPQRGGRLLSFVPTVSNGMSPALESLSVEVVRRFPIPDSQLRLFTEA